MKHLLLIIIVFLSFNSYCQNIKLDTNTKAYSEMKTFQSYRAMGRDMEIVGLATFAIGLKVAWKPSINETIKNGAPVLSLSGLLFLFGFFTENYITQHHLKKIIYFKGDGLNINLD